MMSVSSPVASYNEVVIDATVWMSNMPALVEAIFFPVGSTVGEARARAVRSAFVRTYSLKGDVPPLVRMWPNRSEAPFEWIRT